MLSHVARPLSEAVPARGALTRWVPTSRSHVGAPARARAENVHAAGLAARTTDSFHFTLTLDVRVAAHKLPLQVPRVPPRATWATQASTPRAPAPAWRELDGEPPTRSDPALAALGELLQWLHASPTGSLEEQEASAYWQLCRQQENARARELGALRRGAAGEEGSAIAPSEDHVTAPELAVHNAAPGAADAVRQLWRQGLLSTYAASNFLALTPVQGSDAATVASFAAGLTASALRTHRARSGAAVPAATPCKLPQAQDFAHCLAEMLATALHGADALVPPRPGQYLVTTQLNLAPNQQVEGSKQSAAAANETLGRAGQGETKGASLFVSAVPRAGGTPRILSLA